MNSPTYVSILKNTLKRKYSCLEQMLALVEQQTKILSSMDMDIALFETTIEEKQVILNKINELDDGFEQIYNRVRVEIENNKELYKDALIEIQDLIRALVDKSVKIQGQEKENYVMLSNNFSNKKHEIREFKASNQMVNNYYKNMSIPYQGESFFLDKKK